MRSPNLLEVLIGLGVFACTVAAPGCTKEPAPSRANEAPAATRGSEETATPANPTEAPSAPASPAASDSREAKALAFFAALQSGDAAKVMPFLLTPDDCKFMEEAMKKDHADPSQCREGITRFRDQIGAWLPGISKAAAGLTATGTVRFEPIPEPGAPKWGYMVTVETTQSVDFPLAGFLLDGSYRFAIPMKKKAKGP